ncbi:ferritin family protein [bacterium]|nr:ferritin family protein [bacterium]
MMIFMSVDEILDYAIEREEDAARFYTDLAAKMEKPALQQVFRDFAKEEYIHKARLQEIKKDKTLEPSKEKILNLKIAEYVEEVQESDSDFNYQKALVLAMNREKRAYILYSNLANATDDEVVKNVFLALAQEEAKHKLFFEVEYDDVYLAEN